MRLRYTSTGSRKEEGPPTTIPVAYICCFCGAIMKSKDLKLLRKALAKANRLDYNPLEGMEEKSLQIQIFQPIRTEDSVVVPIEAGVVVPSSIVLSITYVPSAAKLPGKIFQECLRLFEKNMADQYRNSSWGLNMDEKMEELRHANARFLLLTRNGGSEDDTALAGFAHFRFDYDDEESPTQPVVYIYEIQIDELHQRQGLGKKVMEVIEKITLNGGFKKIMLTVFKENVGALQFYEQLNFAVDDCSPSKYNEPADYEILSKIL